jgi:hypothetical protein
MGRDNGALSSGAPIRIAIEYRSFAPLPNLRAVISFFDAQGVLIFMSSDFHHYSGSKVRPPGTYTSTLLIPPNFLINKMYVFNVDLELARGGSLVPTQICSLQVDEMGHDNLGPKYASKMPGVIHPDFEWEVSSAAPDCEFTDALVREENR